VSGQHYTPAELPPGRNLGAHWIDGWVGLRTSLDIFEKRKSLSVFPAGIRTLSSLAATLTVLSWILVILTISYMNKVTVGTPLTKGSYNVVSLCTCIAHLPCSHLLHTYSGLLLLQWPLFQVAPLWAWVPLLHQYSDQWHPRMFRCQNEVFYSLIIYPFWNFRCKLLGILFMVSHFLTEF